MRLLPTALVIALILSACSKKDTEPDTDVGSDPLVFPDYIPEFTVIVKARDDVDTPQDLDFHPNREYELWIINQGTEDSGSDVVIVTDAGLDGQKSERKKDGNAYHFMNTTTALAFSDDNENFATTPEITDANHSGGTFTGPSLWSSNLDVFAEPSSGNGSHLDMLHQSPNSMGIAHEVDNAFWVFDGYTNDIVRYDFGDDHGPGGEDHTDGKLKRYSDLPIKRKAGIPSHMVLDKSTDWLYICDPGNRQVLRMDIESGRKDSDLSPKFETLAKYFQMKDEVWEVFADVDLDRPSGVDLDGQFLYVSDNGTGEIIAYLLSTGEEIGRMQTDASSIMGIKVGPDGKLWYVDKKANKVIRIDQG